MIHRIFVYGTLRRDGVRSINVHFSPARFLSEASISGKLYDLGAYPGLSLVGSTSVAGEIFEIDDTVLHALDAYEGCYPDHPEASEYHRVSVLAKLPDETTLTCQVYEIANSKMSGCPEVPGGDWILHLQTRQP